jgi:hypothetical protein
LVAYSCNPSTWEAGRRIARFKIAWAT